MGRLRIFVNLECRIEFVVILNKAMNRQYLRKSFRRSSKGLTKYMDIDDEAAYGIENPAAQVINNDAAVEYIDDDVFESASASPQASGYLGYVANDWAVDLDASDFCTSTSSDDSSCPNSPVGVRRRTVLRRLVSSVTRKSMRRKKKTALVEPDEE